MSELPNQKFKYKKDRVDWIMISIILFTFMCFGAIYYGIHYYNSLEGPRTGDQNQMEEFLENRAELEREIQEYLSDRDFNPNVDE